MTLATLQEQNYRDLHSEFLVGTTAARGLRLLLRKRRPGSLQRLLRSHLVRGVNSQAEVAARDSVDELLSYLGLLEIAAGVGAIPWPLPERFGANAERILSDPAVKRYYEKFYPLLLPTLFHRRLEGAPLIPHSAYAECVAHFQQFLHLSKALGEADVAEFLWFLDDGTDWDPRTRDWVGLSDFFDVLVRPRRLAHCLARADDQSPVTQAVRGFTRFVSFSQDLDQLLLSTADWPLVQSAFWHHHAYWFYQISGQVGGVLAAGIESFREYTDDWRPGRRSRMFVNAVAETHRLMDRAQLVLQRLTSSVYRAPLEQAYFGSVLGAGSSSEIPSSSTQASGSPEADEEFFVEVRPIELDERPAKLHFDEPSSNQEA